MTFAMREGLTGEAVVVRCSRLTCSCGMRWGGTDGGSGSGKMFPPYV